MKTCRRCQNLLPVDAFHRERTNADGLKCYCKPCTKEYNKERRARAPEMYERTYKAYRNANRERLNKRSLDYYNAHHERLRAQGRERRRRLKDAAYAAYGGYRCNCCGETEPTFLCLDHIHNDGHKHRKEVKTSSLYQWLKVNNYPPGFQVLCCNCNTSKALNNGVCIHQKK